MRKRVLSLLLVLAMLVSVFPAVAANEAALDPKFTTYYLTLNESIAVNFMATGLTAATFDRMEFWKDGVEVQRIDELPAKKDGGYTFRFTALSPDELAKKITVKLYVKGSDEPAATLVKSVKDYCAYILSSTAFDANIKKVVVDLLNYGAAFQTYKGETDPSALANAGLTDAQKAYATQTAPKLESITSAGDQSGYAVRWYSFGLTLKDVVRVYFYMKAESMEGLTLKMTAAGKSWDITEFEKDADTGLYRANFDKLNPVQMREVITAQVFDGDKAVSSVLTTSIESYAAASTDEKVKAVVTEMMKYGSATKSWIEGDDEEDPGDEPDTVDPWFFEDFSDPSLSGWSLSSAKPAGFTIAVNDAGALEVDMGSTGKIDYDKSFAEYKGNATFKLDFSLALNGCTAIDPCIIIARGMNAAGQKASLVNLKTAVTKDGKMIFTTYDGDGGTVTNVECEDGKTYQIQMFVNVEKDTYDFYVDGVCVVEGGKLREDAVSVTGVRLTLDRKGGDTAPKATFDNIGVWAGDTIEVSDIIDGVVIEAVNEIFVSADAEVGQGDGSFDNPFANIYEARDLIRKIKQVKKYPEGGITVYFREGIYNVLSTVVLDAADSGEEGAPVVYTAYEGEKVEFVGGVSFDASNFKPVTDAGILNRLADKTNVKQLDMKALGITDYGQMHVYGMAAGYFTSAGISIPRTPAPELFFGDEIMSVAKYPDTGWLRIASVIETGDVIQNWTNAAHGNDYIPPENRPPKDQITGSTFTVQRAAMYRLERWAEAEDIWVYGFWKEDWSDQSMPVESIDPENGIVKTVIPSGKEITMNRRFYFYNLLEEITVPGEYYIDRENGILYAYLPGETGTLTFGSLEGPVIRFAKGIHDVELVGIELSAGRSHGIKLESASRITIKDCDISKFAMQAISMSNCEDVTVTGCHIFETGTGGITVGYDGNAEPWKTSRQTLEPLGIVVENCEIHDFSRIVKTYSPAISTGGVGMVVRNCKIYNGDHMAISLGGNDTIIENCEIFNVLRTVSDSGALYCGFSKQNMGIVVRNNYVHDVYSSAGSDFSFVYMDDTKDGVTVESNLIVNFGGRGALINGGWDNNFRNNVLINVDTECSLGCIGMSGTLRYNVTESGNYDAFINIYNAKYPAYEKYPHWNGKLEAILESNSPKWNVIEDNVLVNVKKDALSSVGSRLPVWSVADSLANNTVKSGHKYELDEIGFVDYANGDFTIRQDSALFDDIANFKAYDFSKMGLFGQAVEKPKGFGGNGYDNSGNTGDGNGADFETVVTDALFTEEFSDSDLKQWQLAAPNGVVTEVTEAGELEVIMSGLGTVNHVAHFPAYDGKTVFETDFTIRLNGCTAIDSGIIIAKGKNSSGDEVSLVNLKVYVGQSGMVFGAFDGNGTNKSSVVCQDGKTYRAKLVCVGDTYDFYIDDAPVIIGGKMRDYAVSFTGVCINQTKSVEGPAPTFIYDNMVVKPATIVLFEDDFSNSNLPGWSITKFEGLTTEVNSEGQLEVTYGGSGTVNHGSYFEAFAGKVTYETDFQIDLNGCTSVDAGVFIIKGLNINGSEKSLFNLKTYVNNKTFGAYDGGGGTRNTVKWEEGKTYRIQVVCDPETDTYDFYVDGKPVIIGGKMRSDADDVVAFTGVCINQQSVQGNAPTFTYDNMIIYSGDGVADTQPPAGDADEEEEITEGVIAIDDFSGDLSKWSIGNSETASAQINTDGQLEVTLSGGNNGGVLYPLTKKFTCQKKVAIEFDLKIKGDNSTNFEAGFLLKNGSTTVVNVAIRAGKLQAQWGAASGSYVSGTTYRIKVVSDPVTKTIDVYADGTRVAYNKGYLNEATSWNEFQLMIKGNSGSAPLSACYDNLIISVVEDDVT